MKPQHEVDKEFDEIFQLPENVVIPSRIWLDEKIEESKKHIAKQRTEDLESVIEQISRFNVGQLIFGGKCSACGVKQGEMHANNCTYIVSMKKNALIDEIIEELQSLNK